jgi:hypothetical protein
VSFLERAPWAGYDSPSLRATGFSARRPLLRARPRLKPSSFCLRLSVLSEPEQLGYDGTISSLVDLFQTHPLSPWHRLAANSRTQYRDYLAGFSGAYGKRRVGTLIAFDIWNWHDVRSAPHGINPERRPAARAAYFALKSALSFGRACGLADCRALLADIAASGFQAPSK